MHSVGHNSRYSNIGGVLQRVQQLHGFEHRHFFWCCHNNYASSCFVMQYFLHPLGLLANDTNLHQPRQNCWRINLSNNVPGCFGINDDNVVVVLTHFPAQFSNRKNFLHSRCSISNEIQNLGKWAKRAHQWVLHKQANVLTQRIFCVHRHGEQIRRNFTRYKLQLCGVQRARKRTLVIHFNDQCLLASRCNKAG